MPHPFDYNRLAAWILCTANGKPAKKQVENFLKFFMHFLLLLSIFATPKVWRLLNRKYFTITVLLCYLLSLLIFLTNLPLTGPKSLILLLLVIFTLLKYYRVLCFYEYTLLFLLIFKLFIQLTIATKYLTSSHNRSPPSHLCYFVFAFFCYFLLDYINRKQIEIKLATQTHIKAAVDMSKIVMRNKRNKSVQD